MAGTVDGGPLLSVVVPFHDVEGYIRACLESLRDQALAAIEVVMVDDGSTDGSLGVAEEFAAADPRFRILRQANQGLGPARNTGVAAARGRYLTFVDSDDLVTRDGLATLVDSLERTGSDWAGGGAARLDAYGVRGSWSHQERYREERLATCIRDYPLLAADRLVTAKVYRRDFWVDQGLVFPAMRYEDFPMALAANLAATAVDLLPVRTYYWRERHRQDSITQRAADLDNIEDRVRWPAGVRAWTFSCPLRSLSGAAGTRYVLLARRGDDVEPLAVHVDPQLAGELPSVLGTWQVGYRRRSEHPTGALVVDRLPGPARRPRGGWWSRSAGNASR